VDCLLPDAGGDLRPALLIAGAVEDDFKDRGIFDQLPWPAYRVETCRDVASRLADGGPCVVICERDLADGDWRDVLALTLSLPQPPPCIITATLADERLWAEVLNLGGFDVLPKPLDRQEVGRVLTVAWDRWRYRASERSAGGRPLRRHGGDAHGGMPLFCRPGLADG